jgi:hypothetical protein
MDGSLPSLDSRLAYIRSTHDLADQIVELVGPLNAGTYRFLSLIAEFDRRKGWNCRATIDCAHWLNWKCGIDLGAAREKVRTARALEKLPHVSAAMERGEVSYSKVRAITRVTTPENEHYFLQIALHGTAHHVETLVRAHHIKHWAKGGETKMSNLVTLCRFHHRKVHEGQVIVQVLDDGAIRFVQPDGECFESASRTSGDWRELAVVHERAGIHINERTAATKWDGGRMDYGIAIDALMWLRREVSAETPS